MTDDLKALRALVRRQPQLSASEERELVASAKDGCRRAADKLVLAHLPLVLSMARRFQRKSIPLADLVSEGAIGLVIAVGKYDPERGLRFGTCARPWVKSKIADYVRRQQSLVRIGDGNRLRRLFWNLNRTRSELGYLGGRLDGDQAKMVARRLDASEAEVVLVEQHLMPDFSLNAPALTSDETDELPEHIDELPDNSPDPEATCIDADHRQYRNAMLHAALARLPEREREIVVGRRLSEPPATFAVLSDRFGVSRERIRQIEERAIERLRTRMSGVKTSRGEEAIVPAGRWS